MKRGVLLVLLLVAPLTVPVQAPEAAAAHSAQLDIIEGVLPPGARNLLSVFRVLKSLGARNRVYREARSVQRELRTYYDAQIETAQRQLDDYVALELPQSQGRAYWRVLEKLRAERQLVLDLTEDEKRGAKYGFESRLRRELTSVLVRVPRVQQAMGNMRGALGDLQVSVEQVRATLDTGNPISGAIAVVEERLEVVEAFAGLAELVHGPTGAEISSVTDRVRGFIAEVEAPISDAITATDRALDHIGDVNAELDAQIDVSRSVRADVVVRDVALVTAVQAIFTPRGGDRPEVDVMSNAITRGHSLATAADIGRAADVLGVDEFNRMRDRVRAALLGSTLERISRLCGRIIGLARQIQIDAAARGEPMPDTSSPCNLFGNPEALQAFIDAQRSPTTPGEPSDSTDSTVPTPESATPTPESAEDDAERTRAELIEAAAGAYEVTPALEATLWALGDNITEVTADGVIALDSSGDVVGDVSWSYTLTETFEDEPPVVKVIGVEHDLAPAEVTVDDGRLTFTAGATLAAYDNGEQYLSVEVEIDGVFDPPAGTLVLSGVFFSNDTDTITFQRS